ncbi:putative bifunctional diguanylate cyclase/phosphodiesterase [Vibrio sp.]|uniref:putative bifunctional diguanylate cyclase/phosphodiesterase n=1 Tax=Vibrio sp. TaxID=678 RepID=UPI003D0C0221
MKLSLRINYILLPVIVVIFATAGWYAYLHQRGLIISAVSEKMKYTAQYLIADIHKNAQELQRLTENFLSSSETIHFLNSQQSIATTLALETQLIRYLEGFQLSYGELESVSLMDEGDQFIFHFDKNDPFAQPAIDSDLIKHQTEVRKQLKKTGSTQVQPVAFKFQNNGESHVTLMVYRTFSPEHPISSDLFSDSMRFYTAIIDSKLNISNRYLKHLQDSFDKNISMSLDPVAVVNNLDEMFTFSEVEESGNELSIHSNSRLVKLELSVTEEYLATLTKPYLRTIALLVLTISLFTFMILKLLIQKQIISPIVSLTKLVEHASRGNAVKLDRIDDVDEIAQLNNNYVFLFEKLNKMAKFDNLTGLANRALFNASMQRLIGYSLRHEARSALLYIDLDNFKSVNDTYGHHVGDKLLREFSQALTQLFEENRFAGLEKNEFEIARLAGDEFTVLIADVGKVDAVGQVARNITNLCANGFSLDNIICDVKVSIGIAVYPDDASSPDELLKCADSAMYQVKRTGKNGFQFYSKSLDEERHRHAQIESEIKSALNQQEFYLMWMPVYSCRSGEIVGAEALIRADTPLLRDVGPAEFIPVAESIGLIKDIDYWVIESAVCKLKDLIDNHSFDGVISVNFSAWELRNEEFADYVAGLIKTHQVPAEQLELEITETCLVTEVTASISLLQRLKQLGVRLALDDFGTGYTAFNQLVDYPVDTLKVDRRFVNVINEACGTSDKLLVEIIGELASIYNLDVVAEGIETELQLEYIRKIGCDRAQGYYLSKPVYWRQFVDLYRSKYQNYEKFSSYEGEQRLEFKSSSGSVNVITSSRIITLVYKGAPALEHVDFLIKSLPSCIAQLNNKQWGLVIVSGDSYDMSLEVQQRVKVLAHLCLKKGCLDSAYVIKKRETIKQIQALRKGCDLDEDISNKLFDTPRQARQYLQKRINRSQTQMESLAVTQSDSVSIA